MNVEVRTVAAQFLFWGNFFRICGIGSLQWLEMGTKVLHDPDVYAVTCGGEHGEGDGCDEEGGGAGQEDHLGPEVGVPLQEQ